MTNINLAPGKYHVTVPIEITISDDGYISHMGFPRYSEVEEIIFHGRTKVERVEESPFGGEWTAARLGGVK